MLTWYLMKLRDYCLLILCVLMVLQLWIFKKGSLPFKDTSWNIRYGMISCLRFAPKNMGGRTQRKQECPRIDTSWSGVVFEDSLYYRLLSYMFAMLQEKSLKMLLNCQASAESVCVILKEWNRRSWNLRRGRSGTASAGRAPGNVWGK